MPAARHALAALALAVLLGACGLVPSAPSASRTPAADRPNFAFIYTATTGEGYIDQVLTITNFSRRSYVPLLRLEAEDDTGADLPTVRVTTVYGSDRGGAVVPAGSAVAEILRFDGAGADRVAHVRATLVTATMVDHPEAPYDPVVTPLDASGAEVTRNDVFVRVRVANDNDDAVTVRLVYVVWSQPAEGRTQQAEFALPIGDLVTVPAHGATEVPLDAGEAAVVAQHALVAPASIKAYFSH